MKIFYTVSEDFINSRLDRWFRKNVYNAPQSFIQKNVRKGKIKVNNKKEKCSYKLKKDDRITVFNLKFENKGKKISDKKYVASRKDLSFSNSIFVDDNDNFSIINKPPGIAVQSGTKSRRNLLDILRSTNEFKNSSPYSVHRIDKETTGLLIVAKNRKYAQLFTSLFRIRKVNKIYLGIVLGVFSNKNGIYEDELFHYEGKKKIYTKAITHFKVIDSNNSFSLLLLSPKTGRKHQIRKQLLIHGHPILGDKKYRMPDSIKRRDDYLMLHAYKINFSIDKDKFKYVAELPDHFVKELKKKNLKIFQ